MPQALLVLQSINIPKTHNVRALTALVPERFRPHIPLEMQDRLTEYATVTRYPGEYEPVPLVEARVAVQVARRIRSEVRKVLAQVAKRRKH